jgi:hypothetical protein
MWLRTRSIAARTGLALAALIAIAVLALACGDDDGDGTATPTADVSPTASPADGATPASTTPPLGAGAELQALARGWLDGVNGKVAYDYLSNFGQHPDGTYTTYFLDGDDRNDWLNEASGFGVTVVTIITDDKSYVCTLSAANPTCREAPVQEAHDTRAVFLIVLQIAEIVADGVEGATVTSLESEEIAGVQANCYSVSSSTRITAGPAGTEELKYCFSDDGLLLSFHNAITFEDESLQNGDLSLVAKEVGEAEPGDFEPPALVVNAS